MSQTPGAPPAPRCSRRTGPPGIRSALLPALAAAMVAGAPAGAAAPPTVVQPVRGASGTDGRRTAPGPPAPAAPRTRTAAPVVLADPAAWCWFADPRAVAFRGRAVFGWVAGDGSIMVGDDLGRTSVLDPQLERDDHDDPAFYVRRDGRLMAFWSAHNGPAIHYRTADDGIAGWGPVADAPANPPGLGGAVTYPNPLRVGSTLWLFWSGAGTTATFATSPDDGDTWSPARTLFDPAGPRVRYAKYRRDGDEIHVAWTLGHPRERTSAVYHAVIRGDRIEHQDGRPIGRVGVPIDPTGGDVVHPEDRSGAWLHDLVVRDGVPTIAYATFPSRSDHRYRTATWHGRWVDEEVERAGGSFEGSGLEPHYSGGITLDPADPTVAYASRTVGAHHELDRLRRTPEGWSARPITRGSAADNVRPFPVAGGLAWMRGAYPGYTTFRTALVWRPPGSSGTIGAAPGLPRVVIGAGAVRVGSRLSLGGEVRRPGLQLRFARRSRAGVLRIAARRIVRAGRGGASVVVPPLAPGRWRVSAWVDGTRLTWRTVRVLPRRGRERTTSAG